jgi:DNA-binding transcriptional ArsR family regulator
MLKQSPSLDAAFQALADTTRRAMLAQLAQGPASVSDLAQPLAISLSAVMQHLAVLEGAGLVRSEKIGRVRTCRLDPQAMSAAEQWLQQRRSEWEARFDRLGDFLQTVQGRGENDGNCK